MIVDKLRELLAQAQLLRDNRKYLLIKEACDLIWDDISIQDDSLNNLLTDIACILEDYEPNVTWRKESPSYYGDERLGQEIKSALRKLEKYYDSK